MAAEPSRRISITISSDVRTRTIQLKLAERLVIGRASESGPEAPGLDLTPYGAVEHGVSRSHAALSYEDGLVYIEDLDSTSGTRLNGLTLLPHQKYRLRSQDELEFGYVRVTMRF